MRQVNHLVSSYSRLERSTNQVIRDEQDAAYMESLQADQEKVISKTTAIYLTQSFSSTPYEHN